MSSTRTKFYRDKQNGKFMGVCAGIADYTGIDVTAVRVLAVISVFVLGWTPLVYLAIGLIAERKPIGLYTTPEEEKFWQGVRANPSRSTKDVRSKFRDIDRRLADLETFYTSRNQRLADEIDRLR